MAVRRHHDQDNTYRRKHFTVDLLTVSEVSPCREHRHGAGEAAESYVLIGKTQEDKATVGLAWDFENSKPTPTDTLPPA